MTDVSHDALHVLAGTFLWVVMALILRRPLTSWRPLIGVILVVLLNEIVDLWVEIWPERAMQAGEAGKDLMTTIAVPMLLLIVLRLAPGLAGPRLGRSSPRRTAR